MAIASTGRDARLLAALAEPLEPRQPPRYIAGSQTGQPDGWYWTPADATKLQYLGRNVLWAERRLLEHLSHGRPQAI